MYVLLQRLASRWMRVRDSLGPRLGASGRADGGSAMSGRAGSSLGASSAGPGGRVPPGRERARLSPAAALLAPPSPQVFIHLICLFPFSSSSASFSSSSSSSSTTSSSAAATASSYISLAWLCVARSDKDNVPALTLQPPCLLLGFGEGEGGQQSQPQHLLHLLLFSSSWIILPGLPHLQPFPHFLSFFFPSPLPHVVVVIRKASRTPWCSGVLCGRRLSAFSLSVLLSLSLWLLIIQRETQREGGRERAREGKGEEREEERERGRE
ncbi:unnamed protein product [Rangifer tarandus platyrhynchus]|uniref:Uncharacterized protein n=2 Tax=Rangifer tarandus platyrhynchus TaxID=3082113 RepID=A0AC59ZLV1_RANTA|nr:unnamed protein product [Rangifer tarandus platyrhynchus]